MAESSHVIGQANLDAAATVFRSLADELFTSSADAGLVDALSETVPADGGTSTTVLLEDFLGNWELFAGARNTGVTRNYSLNILLSTWAVQMKIPRKQVQYDRTGIVASRIRKFMSASQSYKDKILHDGLFLSSGVGPVGYDGVALFSTAHPNGPSGVQSNLTTSALSPLTFNVAFAAMTSLLRENAEPFRIQPKYLIVGPSNGQTGKEITKSELRGRSVNAAGAEAGSSVLASAGVSNVYNGTVDLIIDPRLVGTQAAYWYLIGEGPGGAKPMFFLEGMSPTEEMDTNFSSPTVMANDAFTFGLKADGNYAAGMWQTAYAGIL